MAERLGVSQSAVNQWEKRYQLAISKAFDNDIREI
nr:helix-turn-helix domain-containing protein [Vibrio parahaemolyticus]